MHVLICLAGLLARQNVNRSVSQRYCLLGFVRGVAVASSVALSSGCVMTNAVRRSHRGLRDAMTFISPERDVLVADVLSGAHGTFLLPS